MPLDPAPGPGQGPPPVRWREGSCSAAPSPPPPPGSPAWLPLAAWVPVAAPRFQGRARLIVKGVPARGAAAAGAGAPSRGTATVTAQGQEHRDQAYFANRKRLFSFVVQGHFTATTAVGAVVTGQDVRGGGGVRVPMGAGWAARVVMGLLRARVPDLVVDLDRLDEGMLVLAPILKVAQHVHVAEEMVEWDLAGEVSEDTARLGGVFARPDVAHSPDARGRALQSPSVGLSHFFEPHHVVTFELYNHHMDIPSFVMRAGPLSLDVGAFTRGKPIALLARVVDPSVLDNTHADDADDGAGGRDPPRSLLAAAKDEAGDAWCFLLHPPAAV